MTDVLIVNAENGEQEHRPATAEEQARIDQDAAEAQAAREAEDAEAAEDDAQTARRAELADRARAGTLTAAERDEALALALTSDR